DTKLGAPSGNRYDWSGVIRRDFANGIALVNEPGAPVRTVNVGTGYSDVSGPAVSGVVRLAAASGIVLVRTQVPTDTSIGTTPTPTPTPTPVPTPTATPTPAPTATPTPAPTAT